MVFSPLTLIPSAPSPSPAFLREHLPEGEVYCEPFPFNKPVVQKLLCKVKDQGWLCTYADLFILNSKTE